MVNYRAIIRSFDDLFYSIPENGMIPPCSIQYVVEQEEPIGVQIQMALAGFTKEDVTITGQNRTLVIQGCNDEKEGVVDKFKQSFTRKWDLKDNLDITKMEGSLENGLLTVTIPFKETYSNKVTLTLK